MQQQILIKLQNVLSQSHSIEFTQNHKQQIKDELNDFYEFISQQFIKLSVHYESKLEYQAMMYEKEINCLNQEIQRQDKVIGLMRLEFEDLIILLNQERNSQGLKQKNEVNEKEISNEEQLMREQENKEWRVKKSESVQKYYEKQQAIHKDPYPNKNHQAEQNTSYSRSLSTISGLQIIAEEQTERTLMSAGDEEENYPNQPDYFDDQQLEQSDSMHQKIQEKTQSEEKIDRFPSETQNTQNHMLIKEDQEQNQEQTQSQEQQINQINPNLYNGQHTIILSNKDISFANQISLNHSKKQIFSDEEDESQISLQKIQSSSKKTKTQLTNHHTSITPKIYLTQTAQKYTTSQVSLSKPYQQTNFVENPFSKKKQTNHTINQYSNNIQVHQQTQEQPTNIQKIKWDSHEEQPEQKEFNNKIFFEEFRQNFGQNYYQSQHQQNHHKTKNQNSVMSILEMIAMNNNEILSKKSQRSSKATSSRSKSKGKNKKSTNSNESKFNTKSKKHPSTNKKPNYYHHQTEEQHGSDMESNSRVTMIRCPTSEDITSSQRYNPTSFEETECFTSNDFRGSEGFETSDNELKHFHPTFGRPCSQEYIKEPLSVNFNRQNMAQNFLTANERKGSMKLKKENLPLKENIGHKENQRQRRMSQKIPQSKSSINYCGTIINKKMSSKYIKPQQNFATQQSVNSMLQSHLQNSNKFLVGTKKQEVKYDGERMTMGQHQIRHGHGTLYYSNGLIYEGQFYQNKRHGFGLLKFNHVELYSGEWQSDELSGKGKIRNCAIINKKKKEATEGTNQNLMGNQMFVKWISYCGQFMSNRFEGEGTLYLQGGEKFVGWFRNGVAHGEGCLYRKNGQVQNGVWRNNVLVERYGFDLSLN